jgi:hypothetical protein
MKASVTFVALVLAAVAAAGASSGSVTLTPSSMTFKQALAACPGALGSVTFTLGHVRVAAASDVSTQTDTSSAGIDTITFSGAGGGATVIANGHSHSVSGKHLETKARNQVACVMPD